MTDTHILQLLAQGWAVKQIADQAKISRSGMEKRIRRMVKVKGCQTVVQMVAQWVEASHALAV
jgi:DNA-binding NarL/FixJ family response regulator